MERRVPSVFRAVHAGAPFADPLHVEMLRDLVALHHVRSHRYRGVYIRVINAVQVAAADRYVYMHPRSGLETFARDKARQRQAGRLDR
ncbi:hypothetical protein [Streptomyces shenzhenensis]|uniref:hypothetical protein n=1 Tax=Streptomyces shenzhenensis TaxID=943815 RepID=UPI00369667C8